MRPDLDGIRQLCDLMRDLRVWKVELHDDGSIKCVEIELGDRQLPSVKIEEPTPEQVANREQMDFDELVTWSAGG